MSCKTDDKKADEDFFANEIIYALTNSRGPFPEELIPVSNKFSPKGQSLPWTSLQAGLFLDNPDTMHYVLLALSLLEAHPDIFDLFPNKVLSFETAETIKFRNKVSGGAFITVGNRVGGISKYAHYFPIAYKYTIRHDDEGVLKVSTDIGRDYLVNYSVSDKGTGSALLVDWHKNLPFKGPLMSETPWADTSKIEIEYIPVSIDYNNWVSYIEAKLIVEEALTPVGLYTAYQITNSGAERIALLILALALQNTSIERNPNELWHRIS